MLLDRRDPLRVVASLASLVTLLRSLASDDVDRVAIGAEWTALLARGLARTTAVRARLPPERVFDMHFADFIRDEIAMVRRIYAHAGWTLEPDAEARMRAFLAANPKDKHGAHRYGLADAGLDLATERARYRDYQEAHRIASEPV